MIKVRRHIRCAAILMLSLMISLVCIKALHHHATEEHSSWETTTDSSYEPICHICLFTASLTFDLVHEMSVYLYSSAATLTIFVLLTGFTIPNFIYNLRAPPQHNHLIKR